MKLYFGTEVVEYGDDNPQDIFNKLAIAGFNENLEFNLINYANILHKLCYSYDTVKFSHIDQVYMNMVILNKLYLESKYPIEVIKLTAVYHDIAKLQDNENHGMLASELINNDTIVSTFLDEESMKEISNALMKHSYGVVRKKERKGKLSKILYDADTIRCVTEFKNEINIKYFIEYIDSLYYKLSRNIMVDMFSSIKGGSDK